MEFKDYFRNDLEHIGCSLSDLSRVSGLSSAVLSRYRSGERIPRKDSELLAKLCSGLTQLETQAGIPPLGRDRLEFYRSILSDDTLLLSKHFDALLRSLQISMKELSRALNYDASYLSRIRSGKRSPSDPNMFAAHVSRVLVDNAKDADLDTIRNLIQAGPSDTLENQLTRWLLQKDHQQMEEITSFLSKLDEFNLDEFIRLFDFARDASIPSPNIISSHKFGQPALRQAELAFLSATAAGNQSGSIFMCNEMPIIDMAGDSEYIKTWMTLIAACLKKGKHLNIIHDINRPFSEMMIGLEGWIPIYMTGEISPYYLPDEGSSIYRHCLYVSDSAALLAECIRGKAEHGVTWITEKKEDIEYAATRAQDILSAAKPLMKIFRAERAAEHQELWNTELETPGKRTIISHTPPIWSLTSDLLLDILKQQNVPQEDAEIIEQFRKQELTRLHNTLRYGPIDFTLPSITPKEFEAHTPILFLAQLFRNYSIAYTWDTYQKHIRLTREFAETTPGFSISFDERFAFRNTSIYTRNERFAAVFKCGSPEISFIMTHPKIVKAIRNFSAPLSDN